MEGSPRRGMVVVVVVVAVVVVEEGWGGGERGGLCGGGCGRGGDDGCVAGVAAVGVIVCEIIGMCFYVLVSIWVCVFLCVFFMLVLLPWHRGVAVSWTFFCALLLRRCFLLELSFLTASTRPPVSRLPEGGILFFDFVAIFDFVLLLVISFCIFTFAFTRAVHGSSQNSLVGSDGVA